MMIKERVWMGDTFSTSGVALFEFTLNPFNMNLFFVIVWLVELLAQRYRFYLTVFFSCVSFKYEEDKLQ